MKNKTTTHHTPAKYNEQVLDLMFERNSRLKSTYEKLLAWDSSLTIPQNAEKSNWRTKHGASLFAKYYDLKYYNPPKLKLDVIIENLKNSGMTMEQIYKLAEKK